MKTIALLVLALCGSSAFASSSYGSGSGSGSGRIKTVFSLKQRAPLSSLISQISDPSSPHFGRTFTPDEIAQAVGMSNRDYRKLVKRLKARGFKVVHEDKTRGYLIVESSAASLEKTFQVKLAFTAGGKHFAGAAPVIPAELSGIQSIVNLDNRMVIRPRLATAAPDGPTSGLGPDDVGKMYGFDTLHAQGHFGVGEKIATVAFDVVNPANVAEYFTNYGITPAANVKVVSVTSTPAQSTCTDQLSCDNEDEDDVDLQMMGRVAPGAQLTSFVGTTDDYLASWVAIFTQILDEGDIYVVNNSDDSGVDPAGSSPTGCEAMVAKTGWVTQVDPLFERAAAQGVNIFSASGDNGSDNCNDGTNGLDWPTSPYIVSVGGTDLDSNSNEIGWSGSGGGFSVLYPRPTWQTATPSSATTRGTPDVALYAGGDPGQAIYSVPFAPGAAVWEAVGGTSLSAPTMAGFAALVNEGRHNAGKSRLPYLNPILYSISPQELSTYFNDIVGGSNGAYTAAAGWDAVTGLGSPKMAALYTYLVNY